MNKREQGLSCTAICRKYAGGWLIMRLSSMLMTGIYPMLQIYATANMLNAGLAMLRGEAGYMRLIISVALFVGTIAVERAGEIIGNYSQNRIRDKLRTGFRGDLILKRSRLSYAALEDVNLQALIARVTETPEDSVIDGMNSVLQLGAVIIELVGIGIALWGYAWWALLPMLIVVGPIIVLGIRGGEQDYKATEDTQTFRRQAEALSDILMSRDSAEERALFGYTGRINADWKEYYELSRLKIMRVNRTWFTRSKFGNVIAIAVFVITSGLLVPSLTSGIMPVSMFIAAVQALSGFAYSINWSLSSSLEGFAKQRKYGQSLSKFEALPESEGALVIPDERVPEFASLEFKDVTFRYPGTETDVLCHLSFRIDANRHYALVGVNGAGKTTVIKLIAGLYTDYEGSILINCRSIETLAPATRKALLAVLFQNFTRYPATLADNVGFGDFAHRSESDRRAAITAATETAGLTDVVSRLPHGLDTELGKLTNDSAELSGGEWQRIALARLLVSHAPLRILDEPTSALDPVSESRLYAEFQKMSAGWTTLFISHRLGSIKLADSILVLDAGRITAQGTHEQLMRDCEIYKSMYEQQRKWYM